MHLVLFCVTAARVHAYYAGGSEDVSSTPVGGAEDVTTDPPESQLADEKPEEPPTKEAGE